MSLKIHSIMTSISGEVSAIPQGSFVTIVRLSNCNCNCSYCDAIEARDGVGSEQEISVIADHIRVSDNINVLITGGEPLLQERDLQELIFTLFSYKNYRFIIETNGTKNPFYTGFFSYVDFVVDYKMPFSGHFTDMRIDNFTRLRRDDYVKFVVDSEYDIKTAFEISNILRSGGCLAKIAIGQTWGWLQKRDFNLVEYLIKHDRRDFIVNFQLHKFLGVE